MVSAILGRNIKFEFGHFHIYPNMYIMLIGDPGARKTTAINIVKKTAKAMGYGYFGPNRTSKEKFMAKLARGMEIKNGMEQGFGSSGGDKDNIHDHMMESFLDDNIFGRGSSSLEKNGKVTECYICNDEFNNFIGIANIDFISLLGELYDYEGVYENELKNSESDYISSPTISILGGNTHTNFATAFPATVLGQGFFSRLLLIYGERTREKITIPPKPDDNEMAEIVDWCKRIREFDFGVVGTNKNSLGLIDKIYKTWKDLEDPRFASYSNRRFTHLLKISLTYAATRFSKVIEEADVIKANTVLSFTEQYMSKAMGEIGRNRHSETMQKIMNIINNAEGIVTFNDIWRHCTGDLERMADLGTIIQNLLAAGKIQSLPDGRGLLPNKRAINEVSSDLVDYSIISVEERNMKR